MTNGIGPQRFIEYAAGVVGSDFIETRECCVMPEDAAQASHLLRFAEQNRVALEPRGAGTKLTWQAGDFPGACISTRRMNAVVEHTWQDMTCTVQAGCTWSDLQNRLAEQGQFVALDPLWPERATVGGVVATNDSGALRLRYGGLRDLVIGMTIVLPDGTVAKSGGKVVKNVAGYDLPKLMCGSFGTLALIADVTFRLHSKPLYTRTFSFRSNCPAQLGEIMVQIRDRHFSVQSMQLSGNGEGFELDLRLMAMEQVVQTQAGLLRMLGSLEETENGVWDKRQRLFDEHSDGIFFKATMPATSIPTVLQLVADARGEAVAQTVGTMYGWLPADASGALYQLRAILESSRGSVVVLSSSSKEIDRSGKLPDSITLMRAIKQQFDPNACLNPGRFLGGI